MLSGRRWIEEERWAVLSRSPHGVAVKHVPFLRQEFASIVEKGKWAVLFYLVAKRLPRLRLSSPSVKEERDRWPCWFGDYSFNAINVQTLPFAPLVSIQYGCALD